MNRPEPPAHLQNLPAIAAAGGYPNAPDNGRGSTWLLSTGTQPGAAIEGRRWLANGPTWVLARSRCRYLYVPYDGVPANERRNRLQVQLQVWAPFEVCGHALVDSAQGCAVWAWDAAAAELQGVHPTRTRWLPETLLRPAHTDGVVLQPCIEGVEGQHWRDGQLRASRWWPTAPDAAAWLNFQRGAGVAVPVPLPPLHEPAPAPGTTPWARSVTPQGLLQARRLRTHAVAGGLALLLLLPTLWLGLGWWRAQADIAALQAQARALETELQPVLRVRSDALQGLGEIETLTALVDRPAPLALLAHLSARLPADGSLVRELDWEGRRVRLLLQVPARTPRIAYVQALEDGGWLGGVREEVQDVEPGLLALVAELRGRHPPGPRINDAAAAPPAPR